VLVDFNTLVHVWPEVILVILATWIYVVGAFQTARLWWAMFALAGYAVAGVVLVRNEAGLSLQEVSIQASVQVSGPVVVDYLGYILRATALLVGVLFTLVAARTVRREVSSEYFGTLMLLVVGIMLVARANDLVLLFVGLELISVPTYVLLYLGRRDRATSEAAAKYFFLSVFASAVLLYGVSFVYGVAGTTVLLAPEGQPSIGATLTQLARTGETPSLLPLATVFVAAGLGFKVAAVPFHFYAPDVFQGATNGNAGLLAVAPKLGGLAALIRLLVVAMPDAAHLAWQLLLVVTIATMTLGNICALWQKNLRRLMAYSSIAHAGYMLIGITVASQSPGADVGGISSALLYIVVYTLASAGTFAALSYLGGVEREVNGLEDIAGLSRQRPLAAAAIAVCMFSLAGIPPMAGFWGKLTLFSGAVRAATDASLGAPGGASTGLWMTVLAVAGALNAATAAAYYLRVVAVMYFTPAQREHGAEGGWGAQAAMSLAAILVVSIGLFPGTLIRPAQRAEQLLARPGSQQASTLPNSRWPRTASVDWEPIQDAWRPPR
jgi:NADH-quinone oxidoreductase subunit N